MFKLEVIVQVHQLKRQGFKISAIARKCNLSRTTVYEYLEKDFEEACRWVDVLRTRKRKLDPYQDHILGWLKEHPDLSASQISDWLEERCSFTDVGDSTVRTYVRELREKHHIPKTFTFRRYEALEELPKGQQLQVDFGEIKVPTFEGKWKKLYVVAFVLSHSRYKYSEWQDRPFTTHDVLRSHENAFEYYDGMPEEIVYDQDKLMTVSENGGDIIYTEAFQSYKQQRGFSVYLCRAADPESKGKVENVVKFIKQNFAKNRIFHQIETWNEQCLAWLKRKGNYQVHNTIKKRPVEVFALEKPHLRKVSSPLSFESNHRLSITRTVHKDNIIKYQSNRYSVPLGTYQPHGDNTVYLRTAENKLIIEKTPGGAPIATHPLSLGKGQLVKNNNHFRDRSKGIKAYMDTVKASFDDQDKIQLFLEAIYERYPRYIRDQLQIVQRAAKDFQPFIQPALNICIEQALWSANDFHDVVKHLSKKKEYENRALLSDIPTIETSTIHYQERASLRELDDYLKILGGV
ncbi:IS21 family transposase [Lentibacillus amyloliquefaciens]|uniref:Transposase n=1 Tax=Lentibacillus amyloliquefaciens TaxID=1472767 RepID=A0A0U4FVB0_9BACI|nr:IS21 family transposase [Lentibacillus amyloliquefaciens]ALX47624.1 transposase [Lentibacillus amyloliquefaciens]ALX49717.1 transposase [Lentibacillus amyloliquefaciens]